jgi:MFS family permease
MYNKHIPYSSKDIQPVQKIDPSTSRGRILTPLGIGIALSLLGDQTLYVVLADPNIAAQAGISTAMVGIVLGINRLTRLFSNSPAGMLYDRFNRRTLMILSLALGSLSTLFYALAEGATLLLIGRVLWGIAWSGIWIGANTIALDISADDNRGVVSGRLQMWFFLGAMVSSLAAGFFTDFLGYHDGLRLSAGLTFLGMLIWLIFLPETRKTISISPRDHPTHQARFAFPWRITLATALPLFLLRFVVAGVLNATTILWLSQFLETGFSLKGFFLPLATLTGVFSALRVLLSMISAPFAGYISDRFQHRWWVMTLAHFISALGLLYMAQPSLLPAVGGALLVTISAGGIQALVPAIIGDRIPNNQKSRVLSTTFTIGDLGSALGPAAGLALIPIIGIQQCYQICALLYALIFIFAFLQALREKSNPILIF